MSIKISHKNQINEKLIKNYVLFSNEDFKINGLSKLSLNKQSNQINRTVNSNKSKKKEFIIFNHSPDQKIILIKIKNKQNSTQNEKNGANFYNFVKSNLLTSLTFFDQNISETQSNNKNFIDEFLHGMELKSYEFNKYKTKKETADINIIIKSKILNKIKNNRFSSLLAGTNFTKDLVSEPGNILHPDEYAKRLLRLKKIGLKIKVYNEKELKKLGMGALLGVGQGSIRGSYLVTMEWNGKKSKSKPLAFVGKGVCFDTGGYSLKPARFMEDMTYDMAGSAAVVGLMKTLALRKAKINAVGVVGLVENMVSGNAQRPGDIVKSYSGKTIEVLNTDAEGRLVLADALTFTEKKFEPQFIVDLATLTGAIIVSLGSEYAGLFSNDDKLSKQLLEAGENVDEKLWRMPLHKNFDKLMNSKNADVQNINYVGGAGSTTAAQFLQRFILNKTPWAHLDIAGMAFSKYGGALNSSGATAYGVRLLNKLVEDYYE
ncbi:leucyl aminopeptidase [Pelagibacterales bacterium SAG-MED15]|nr:leucyl aminopeptidase [Pelagibacterales bacterium SAG-MED15]